MELYPKNKKILLCGKKNTARFLRLQLEKNGIEAAECPRSTDHITASLQEFKPDMLLYFCGHDDGVNIKHISAAAQSGGELKIVAAAFNNTEERLRSYEQAGAFRTVIMPIEEERFIFLLTNLLTFGSESEIPAIADFLHISGFSHNTMGFIPLCRMIELCCRNPQIIKFPIKARLTRRTAEEFGYKPVNLDKLIRVIAMKEYEKRTISRLTGRRIWYRPGNHALISLLCDKYTTYSRGGVPHRLPWNAEALDPEPGIREIKERNARKKNRRWVFVGKPKTD